MIISHKYKFIFVKTRKTAGTSIEVYLSQHCGEDDILTPISPVVEPHTPRNHLGIWNPLPEITCANGPKLKSTLSALAKRRKFNNHIPAQLIKQRLPTKIWNSYHKFCVERNPWDKTLSHYHMIKDRTGGTLTLDQYLEKGHLCLNLPKYTSPAGDVLVDQIIKYEGLSQSIGKLFDKLGVPYNGSLDVWAKSNHRKDRSHYREIYTGKQREQVRNAFSEEIRMHNYDY